MDPLRTHCCGPDPDCLRGKLRNKSESPLSLSPSLSLSQAEYQLQERYFDPLVKKEQMEEKMKGTREMKCRAVSCKKVPWFRCL